MVVPHGSHCWREWRAAAWRGSLGAATTNGLPHRGRAQFLRNWPIQFPL